MTVPVDWMPDARITGIVVHWTGGRYEPNGLDRQHYHILIKGDGTLVRGNMPISANDARFPDRRPRANHTLNLNTGFIGVSLCCMAKAQQRPFDAGPAPLTKEQWAALPKVLATLCARYKVPVTPRTVLSHAEVQGTLGVTQRQKWDISILPFAPGFDTASKVGARFREWTQKTLSTRNGDGQ
jgi:hypothetical protein